MKVILLNVISQWPEFNNEQVFVYLRNTCAFQATLDNLQKSNHSRHTKCTVMQSNHLYPTSSTSFSWRKVHFGDGKEYTTMTYAWEGSTKRDVDYNTWGWCTRQCCTDKLVAFITMYFNIQLWIWMQRTSDLTDNFSGNCTYFSRHS